MFEYLPYIVGQIVQPYNIALLVAGCFVGIIFGAIPGLSGTLAVMLFMPMTFAMEAGSAIIFLLALWIGGCSGAFIGSVLLGIPGSASAVSTCWDGYPMAQQGKAGKALAIGMIASFTGTFFSAIIGALLSQKIADIAFMLGPWEYFGLCLLAITMVLAISKGNMFKGLASASLGLLLATVGFSPIDAEPRFVFGNMYLMGGLGMTVVLLGIFGVSHIIVDFAKGYPPTPEVNTKGIKGLGVTLKEIKEQLVNIIRSFLIGLGIGFLPGMGSGLSNLVAYSSAKNASKDPDSFGKGNPAGLWAPEVANNASIGGAMIPMAALGIPGDSTTALLIGALTIHGLEMGPMVFRNSGHVVYLMFSVVMVCAVVILLMQSLGMRVFPHILKVPPYYMYPALLIISLISGYVDSSSLYKCGMMIVFAGVGVLMSFGGLPTAPLILAFILQPILELNMLKAFQYTGTVATFFTRPLSCIFCVIAIGCVFWPFLGPLFGKLIKKLRGPKDKGAVNG
ncbi:tripartite tricarboxylate transporter permease [Breznakiella homolactica]|uniref:Tripartite tricarboxylate transporter permease n=1 Tax=Breznakiella homolactica TaxID=2798577 RepID=A0A7T8BAU2_9SPIR|nr:tripartite tricarboxylate transporter permease [Breznakiella homolactica]QQO08508.1 tripartite tricarboxylate transporter permease [Breznakiella homolactica]